VWLAGCYLQPDVPSVCTSGAGGVLLTKLCCCKKDLWLHLEREKENGIKAGFYCVWIGGCTLTTEWSSVLWSMS